MILVTRINKVERFYINDRLIEFMEETPDTVISLESGKKIVVMESAQEVIELIVAARRRELGGLPDVIRQDRSSLKK